MKETFSVESVGATVNFDSNRRMFEHFQSIENECFVPDMHVSQELSGDFALSYRNSSEEIVDFSQRHIQVRYSWSLMRSGETLLYLAYPLIEYQRQKNASLTAHAACVAIKDKGILLLGKEGSGKSSTAIQLCIAHEAKLVANDLCVIDYRQHRPLVTGGTKFLFLRYESMQRNLPWLLHGYSNAMSDTWLSKVKFQPSQFNIAIEQLPVSICRAYIVHIDETKSNIYVDEADSMVTRLYLYENFSRYIRSTCTLMLGGHDFALLEYIPSFDQKDFYEGRKHLIIHLVEKMRMQYISGPLSKVANHIAIDL